MAPALQGVNRRSGIGRVQSALARIPDLVYQTASWMTHGTVTKPAKLSSHQIQVLMALNRPARGGVGIAAGPKTSLLTIVFDATVETIF
jgi:hypothetical protein